MTDLVWDGLTTAEPLNEAGIALRQRLADAAKAYDWPQVFALLTESEDLVNVTRPGGSSWYTPLHQAAHGGAPTEVVERLLVLGAWRTLRTANGERALEIARRQGH